MNAGKGAYPGAAIPSQAPRSSRLPPGELVAGRFALESVIGEGASGVVYAASDRALGRPVALKVLHRHLLTDQQISRRFHREAAILRRLEGPNLVKLYDFGEHAGLLYMAMELARGESLETLMIREGPLAIPRTVAFVMQVLSALETAHRARVIHRDLKPANVMIEPEAPDGERVRVLDFGMAKVLRGEGLGTTVLTEQNMVFGTPEYMSPEQARGDEVDARCDIYAAGIILYELLTGSVPFTGYTAVGTMTAHLTKEPAAPSARAPARAIPVALEAVVLHAMAKNAAERYPSAVVMRAALTRASSHPDDTVSVRPPKLLRLGFRTPTRLETTGSADSIAPTLATLAGGIGRNTWIAVALLAAGAGVAIGIWVSLHW